MHLKNRAVPPPFRTFVSVLARGLLCAAAALALADPVAAAGAEEPDAQRALNAAAELRRHFDPAATPVVDGLRALTWRGRSALEITGRSGGGDTPGPTRDQAIFDAGTGRIVSFIWFPHASARSAGEPIISLGEASTRADAHLRAILPRADLALEGIERHRADRGEAVYYEAVFTAPAAEIPFLRPPVRLLLDASTGNLFRFEADPEWFSPPRMPAAHLTRKAAERVAAAALRTRDLAAALGAGAALGKVGTAEPFIVRANDWLEARGAEPPAEARVAWVVPFSLDGEASRTAHRVFVDAATGRFLGGLPGAVAGAR